MHLPTWVTCAKCEKPVDRVDVEEAPDRCSWRMRVYCHGEREEMSLTRSFIENMRVSDVVEARAFSGWPLHAQQVAQQLHIRQNPPRIEPIVNKDVP